MNDQAAAGTGTSAEVVVIGTGSGGQNVAIGLAQAGRSVVAIEDRLVGGECKYLACIPSKALLRSAEVRHQGLRWRELGAAALDPSRGADDLAYRAAVARRDELSQHRDDAAAEKDLREAGVRLLRGRGRVVVPGLVQVNGHPVGYGELVVATGSRPRIPDVPGLDQVPVWTSDQLLSSPQRPTAVIVLGGGPVGCEIAQLLARFGVRVALIEPGGQLLGPEEPSIARLLHDRLAEEVDVRLEVSPERAQPHEEGVRLHLSDGSQLDAERVVVAVGRAPRIEGIGLETLGINRIDVEDTCRVRSARGVWAVGDVTQVAPYTHTAAYQARVLVTNLLGGDSHVVADAIPRAVYTDPPVASVGIDAAQARDRGIDAVCVGIDLRGLPRNNTDGGSGGRLVLTADRAREVLLGAAAVGPHADEWIGESVVAIRAGLPLELMSEIVHPFPTIATAYESAYRKLLDMIR